MHYVNEIATTTTTIIIISVGGRSSIQMNGGNI